MGSMLSLTDSQLDTVMDAAGSVPIERRSVFLERVGAILRMRGRFTNDDVTDATRLAIIGLVQRTSLAS